MVWLPAKLAPVLGVPVSHVRRMPLALALLYLNDALQQDGLLTFWADGNEGAARRGRSELASHIAELRGGSVASLAERMPEREQGL